MRLCARSQPERILTGTMIISASAAFFCMGPAQGAEGFVRLAAERPYLVVGLVAGLGLFLGAITKVAISVFQKSIDNQFQNLVKTIEDGKDDTTAKMAQVADALSEHAKTLYSKTDAIADKLSHLQGEHDSRTKGGESCRDCDLKIHCSGGRRLNDPLCRANNKSDETW